ncbi:protein of unknown function [Ekhidna lutea]|uniref:DUF4296 domain-containing protein n=1 Tax=Ekhidna lutea TaxID=447679 RepID=A0A239M2M7_EKHLU|nr:protein of unknown function [Ekhidna lutea]
MRSIFLTVLVIVCSCTGSNVPEDLINREKMVKVMTEIHLLESKISNLYLADGDSIQVVYDHYEKLLFQDLGITQDQYERSFNYYVDNPNEFEKIYTTVVDSLMEKEKRFK